MNHPERAAYNEQSDDPAGGGAHAVPGRELESRCVEPEDRIAVRVRPLRRAKPRQIGDILRDA